MKTHWLSRLKNTPSVIFRGQATFGLWAQPSIISKPLNPSDTITVVVPSYQNCRPDLIAKQYYGNSELDWLIIAYNNSQDVFGWPKTGTVITIPSPYIVATQFR